MFDFPLLFLKGTYHYWIHFYFPRYLINQMEGQRGVAAAGDACDRGLPLPGRDAGEAARSALDFLTWPSSKSFSFCFPLDQGQASEPQRLKGPPFALLFVPEDSKEGVHAPAAVRAREQFGA